MENEEVKKIQTNSDDFTEKRLQYYRDKKEYCRYGRYSIHFQCLEFLSKMKKLQKKR